MARRRWLLVVVFAGCGAAWVAQAAEFAGVLQADDQQASQPSAKQSQQAQAEAERIPPPLKRYKGRRIAPTMHYSHAAWLLRDVRQQEEDCEQLLQVLDVQPGQIICDLGCGNGFYTLRLAEMVGPEGKVLAVDIQPEMLSMLNERLQQANVQNVEPILG
ncbi:MAG: class I SAM-dependent methyltransferase, partial [Pirellulales bacterium]|nr:class I SAM-dependent methyltransferase [Pirellulales bacterium]